MSGQSTNQSASTLLTETGRERNACIFQSHGRELVLPHSAFTHEGFRAWAVSDDCPEFGRYSFLDGRVLIDLDPEEVNIHGQIRLAISTTLYSFARRHDIGRFFPNRALLTNESAHFSTESDASFATYQTLESGKLSFVPLLGNPERCKELQGTPDWVLEVVSDHTIVKDKQELRELYYRSGIPEYWLIDPCGDQIVFEILAHGKAGYEAVHMERGGWIPSGVFHRRVRLTREQERLNHWSYRLELKPLK